MSIPQLKNPKQLSYSGMRKQVRELARRMNILTEMKTVSVEATAAAKFTFSGDDATLDVPSVEDAVGLLECEEELAECDNEKLVLEAEIIVLEEVVCTGNDAIKQLTGLDVKDGGYFEVRNGTAVYQIGLQDPVPVTVSFIIYQKPNDSYAIYRDSSTASNDAEWGLYSNGVIFAGPYEGNVSGGSAWSFSEGVNCNAPITLRVYNVLAPSFQGSSGIAQLPCPDDFIDICAEPIPE